SPAVNAAGKDKPKKGQKGDDRAARPLDPALAVGGERDGIPLRVAPYVMETDGLGTARVVIAAEVGTAPLTFTGTASERTAQLDVTVLGISRDGPGSASLDSHVALGLDAKAVGGWWMFSRELRLPPGPAQIRALVRDSASGRRGIVSARVEIPAPGVPYLSTVISDRMTPAVAGRAPQLMPVAHRAFASDSVLYCAYEAYVTRGQELQEMPEVTGAYRIEDEKGRVVASDPPTAIAIALGAHIVRVLAFPLARLTPGSYRLTIEVADRARDVDLQAHETFVVEPKQTAALDVAKEKSR
ncbi:MAG TPA: hypothetical protein VGQ33_21860, partial [Vicinamibacteria bacterium]|nr:hypothetical protein [Vicinamibacteria bacterium]